MPLSMYQASVPVFTRALNNLAKILDKVAAFAEARKIDQSVLINARLAPDMLPLSRQVQIACDMALRGTARLASADFSSVPDTETTWNELKARIDKTLRFIEPFPAAKIDGSEDRSIAFQLGGREVSFAGRDYLLNFVLPNIYFHVTAAYLILRHNGVDLGKADFLGDY